jgi:HK97 family phage prohead protease
MDISARASQTRELRAFTSADLNFRDTAGGGFTFDGIASVTNTAYQVRDQWGDYAETIAPGAFNRTLKQRDDVRLLINHEGVPLARTKSGTLKLSAAPDLRAVAELDPANPKVQEIRSAMSRGDLDQMSIGFRVKDQEWNADYTERNIKELVLFDVSVVTYPASPTTTASLRSFDALMRSLKDVEMTSDEARRAIKSLERRFSDVWNDGLEEALCYALCAALMCMEGEVEVEDFNDTTVIYAYMGVLYEATYTLDANNLPQIDMTNPTPVVEVVTYTPLRSASEYEARDRADRERLERKIAARPAPLV